MEGWPQKKSRRQTGCKLAPKRFMTAPTKTKAKRKKPTPEKKNASNEYNAPPDSEGEYTVTDFSPRPGTSRDIGGGPRSSTPISYISSSHHASAVPSSFFITGNKCGNAY